MDQMTEHHSLEFSQTIDPNFCLGNFPRTRDGACNPFEFSMVFGATVHMAVTFSISEDGSALRIEWMQEYPV
jgi:hypothetical protein